MSAEIHPFSRATYERTPEGLVRVAERGFEGLFRWDGRWVSGELRTADPHFCLWVAGGYGGSPGHRETTR